MAKSNTRYELGQSDRWTSLASLVRRRDGGEDPVYFTVRLQGGRVGREAYHGLDLPFVDHEPRSRLGLLAVALRGDAFVIRGEKIAVVVGIAVGLQRQRDACPVLEEPCKGGIRVGEDLLGLLIRRIDFGDGV